MTDARIVSTSGDGVRASPRHHCRTNPTPQELRPNYRNWGIVSCAYGGCRRGNNAENGERPPRHHRVAWVAGVAIGVRTQTERGQISPTTEAHMPAVRPSRRLRLTANMCASVVGDIW